MTWSAVLCYFYHVGLHWLRFGAVGSDVGQVSTDMGDRIGVQRPVRKIFLINLTNHPGQLSLAIPVGRRYEYRPKGGDGLRLGVKADMVLFAGNTV